MSEALKIFLIIVGILLLIISLGLSGWFVYARVTKKGTCVFVPFVPSGTASNTYTQVGYFSCSGGFSPTKSISVKNVGVNTYYVGTVVGTNTQELDPGNSINIQMGNIYPNVYVQGNAVPVAPTDFQIN